MSGNSLPLPLSLDARNPLVTGRHKSYSGRTTNLSLCRPRCPRSRCDDNLKDSQSTTKINIRSYSRVLALTLRLSLSIISGLNRIYKRRPLPFYPSLRHSWCQRNASRCRFRVTFHVDGWFDRVFWPRWTLQETVGGCNSHLENEGGWSTALSQHCSTSRWHFTLASCQMTTRDDWSQLHHWTILLAVWPDRGLEDLACVGKQKSQWAESW